jgi:hypothetical protein
MKPTVSLLIPFKQQSKKLGVKYDPSLHEKPSNTQLPRLVKQKKRDGTITELEAQPEKSP